MKNKKIFVTGAMGFIGHHWCQKLLDQGHKVYALDIKKPYPQMINNKNFLFFKNQSICFWIPV